jgi:hypothetical protein
MRMKLYFDHRLAAAFFAIVSSLGRHPLGSRLPAAAPQHGGGTLSAISLKLLGLLDGRDPHDLDGIADHVGGALLASGPLGMHRTEPRDFFAVIIQDTIADDTRLSGSDEFK